MAKEINGGFQSPCPVSVVILDLDNTLWDWVEMWHRSFRAMLDELVLQSGISEAQLLPEIKAIHEKHGTTEYAFLIQELPSLQRKHPKKDIAKIYDSAIKAFRHERKRALTLYDGVEETLNTIRDAGALIVGFTDSRAFYTASRVRRLGLDRLFDYLYSPPDHELPDRSAPEAFRMLDREHYELRRTVHRHTPEGERKPNPDMLRQILHEVGATPGQVVYVGDSLMKDVAMAQDAGVLDAWAKYGLAQKKPEYELLRQVSDWPASSIQREMELSEKEIRPTLVLETGLSDLLGFCRFTSFRLEPSEREKLVVGIWSKTIDVQQHFNDLELRIRNYAVTLLVAILGASAFALKEDLRLGVGGWNLSLAAALLSAGAFGWLAFYLMDRFWYHRLLYGAVKHGLSIEKRWGKELPDLGLTETIGDESPVSIFGKRFRSTDRIDIFYGIVLAAFVGMAITVQCGTKAKSVVPQASTPVVSGPLTSSTATPTPTAVPIPTIEVLPSVSGPGMPMPGP